MRERHKEDRIPERIDLVLYENDVRTCETGTKKTEFRSGST